MANPNLSQGSERPIDASGQRGVTPIEELSARLPRKEATVALNLRIPQPLAHWLDETAWYLRLNNRAITSEAGLISTKTDLVRYAIERLRETLGEIPKKP